MNSLHNKWIAGIIGVLVVVAFITGCATRQDFLQEGQPGTPVKIHRVTEINGVRQFLDIRGASSGLPVLLIVHGGPGTPETPLFNYYCPDLEKYFIVVNWDQRGAGASFVEEIPPEETMTVDQFIEDTKAVTDLMLDEFDQEKIYIMGHSWGSKLAMLAVDRYPDKYLAYIGIGLSVNVSESEPKNYQLVYKWAKEDGNEAAIRQLESISSPPFTTFDFNDPEKIGIHRMWAMYYGGGPVNLVKKDLEATMGLLHTALTECEGYSHFGYEMSIEKFYAGEVNLPQAFREETNNLNLDEVVTRVDVPVYILQGIDDAQTSYDVAREYFQLLDAPHKEFFPFDHSSHSPPFEEPEKFYRIMKEIIAAMRDSR